MGVSLKVLDPTPDCPASVVAQQTLGSFRDPDAVREFARGCDVLTVEIEHIDADAMQVRRRGGRCCGGGCDRGRGRADKRPCLAPRAPQAVADESGAEVQPTPHTMRVIQDKFRQKQHFEAAGVPLPGAGRGAAWAACARPFAAWPSRPCML